MSPLSKRQCTYYSDGACQDSWWWSDTGLAVRYTVVVLFFAVIIGFLIFSYLHARRRIRKGLPPLGYHRWLVSRRSQQQHYNYENPSAYYQRGNNGPAYGMQNFHQQAPPPPQYNNTWDAPPQYQPPEGGSKVLANQNLGTDHHGQAGQSSSGPEVQRPNAAYPGPPTRIA